MRYFDLHCDTASKCRKLKIYPDDLSLAASVLKGGALDEWRQCFAIFIDDNCIDKKREYLDTVSDFKQKISRFKTPGQILTLENAACVDSADFTDVLKADGIRAVTLTWNGENALAGGCHTDIGLKPFGREVVAALNRRHIAVDLSHLSRQSFFEIERIADTVFASHSCCDKTHRHPRNLTDEQIRLIASHGGVIGVCFYPEFLGTKYSLEGFWRHINHLLNMGLENHICIGSDFDGAAMSDCLDGVDKIPVLYTFLMRRGIDCITLDKIFFSNAEKFFENF